MRVREVVAKVTEVLFNIDCLKRIFVSIKNNDLKKKLLKIFTSNSSFHQENYSYAAEHLPILISIRVR